MSLNGLIHAVNNPVVRVGVNLVVEVNYPLVTAIMVVEVEFPTIILNSLAWNRVIAIFIGNHAIVVVDDIRHIPINIMGPSLLIIPNPVVVKRCR